MKNTISAQTKTIQAYKAIRKMLIAGDFSDTHIWSFRSLSKYLGVSISPVLGAIRRLEQQGLLVVQPQRGIAMRSLNRHQVAQAYIVREALEVQAARLIALARSTEIVKQLNNSAKLLLKLQKNNDLKTYAYEDFLFHRLLVEGSNCEMLLNMYDDVAILCMITEGGWNSSLLQPEASNHMDVVKAIATFDPDIAEKAIRAHISRMAK